MEYKVFIDELSRRLDISRENVMKMIESMSESIGIVASEMDSVTISNFGVFEPRLRKERIAVHPATGKKILVPPRIVLAFKAAPIFKHKIRNEK